MPQAIESSVRLVKEGGAAAVKLEGGVPMADTIEAITRVDIPVMAHIGLTPQSFHRMGGHRVQGRHSGSQAGGRDRLLADAKAVEAAGAFSVVLEGMPRELAAEITASISIPTIGIGAGPECDGQVLVLHDVLGLTPEPVQVRQGLRRPALRGHRRARRPTPPTCAPAPSPTTPTRSTSTTTSVDLLDDPAAAQRWSGLHRKAGQRIGFVPDDGGAARRAPPPRRGRPLARAAVVVVSIFVNPIQFNQRADFDQYPRPIEDDRRRCEEAGVDALYVPTAATMYPAGFQTHVDPGPLGEPMEGTFRPGPLPRASRPS